MAEMAVIVPGKGETKQVVQHLLELADDPRDVATTSDGPDGVSFVVPDELYDRYLNDVDYDRHANAANVDADEEVDSKSPAVGVVDEGAPAPKRRGRPPGSKNRQKGAGDEE